MSLLRIRISQCSSSFSIRYSSITLRHLHTNSQKVTDNCENCMRQWQRKWHILHIIVPLFLRCTHERENNYYINTWTEIISGYNINLLQNFLRGCLYSAKFSCIYKQRFVSGWFPYKSDLSTFIWYTIPATPRRHFQHPLMRFGFQKTGTVTFCI